MTNDTDTDESDDSREKQNIAGGASTVEKLKESVADDSDDDSEE